MNKLSIGTKLEHKVNGEIAAVTELGDKISVTSQSGETKSYALSSLKRLFKVVQDEVTENVITNEIIDEVDEVAADENENKIEEENNMENQINENNLENEEIIKDDEVANVVVVNKKAAMEKLVETILHSIAADTDYKDIKFRELSNGYASAKVTRNFVDLTVSSKTLKVGVMNLDYSTELESKIADEKYGWRLSTIFTLKDDSNLAEIMRIIKISYLNEIKPNEKDIEKAKAKEEKAAAKAKAKEEAKLAKEVAKATAAALKNKETQNEETVTE